MNILPTLTDGTMVYTFQTLLDGVTYGFTLSWNERESEWYFELDDASGNPIVSGRKVILNLPMLARFKYASLPTGDLVAFDTTGQGMPAGLNDLGDRVLFMYVEQDEIQAILAGTYTG